VMHSLVEAGPPRLASFNGLCHGFAHVGPHGSVRKTLLANPGECMNAEHDKELILSFLNGNESAFEELHKTYADDVKNVISNYVPRHLRGEVDDIIQHFWIGFLKHARSYDPARPVRPWLLSSAVKAASTYRQKQIPRSKISLATFDKIMPLDEARDSFNAKPQPGPVEALIFREDLAHLCDALKSIPAVFSKIIRAVYLDCQTPKQYALENGIPIGTVYTQLNRGIRHLREALGTA